MSLKSGWFPIKGYDDFVFVLYDYEPGTPATLYSKHGDPGSPGSPPIIDIRKIQVDTFLPDLTDILSPESIEYLLSRILESHGGKR